MNLPRTAPAVQTPFYEIPLSAGKVAIVDREDFDRVLQFKWSYTKPNPSREYAIRQVKREDGKWTTLYLHRFILDAPRGQQVDHADGNGLNCRRSNLRLSSQSQNLANRRGVIGETPYRGVGYRKSRGVYRATITIDKRPIHLGHFDNAVDAALAYDSAAREHFGPFARLNFPGAGERPAIS